MPSKIVAVVGPTASGKTKLAVALALALNGEVVSADSMQIYRSMDIGTAKPTKAEMCGIPHHMLDVADPREEFSVARYVSMATQCIEDILSRGKLPIVAGGTGLYIDSLISGRTFAAFDPSSALRQQLTEQFTQKGGADMLEELAKVDPQCAQRLHPNDAKRIIRALEVWYSTGKTITQHNLDTQSLPPRYTALRLGLAFERREDLWAHINRRVDAMMEAGLVDEVRALLQSGVDVHCTAMQAIGYKELAHAVRTGGDISAAAEEVKLRSRQYAKRQLTWFARGDVHWHRWTQEPDFMQALRDSTEKIRQFGL